MKANRYLSIRRLVFICMVLVPAIPFAVTLMIGRYYFSASLENSAISTIERIVSDHGRIIDSFLSERKADLDFIISATRMENLKRQEDLERVFSLLKKKSGAFIDLGVFDTSGLHISYTGPYALAGIDYSDTDWFKEVMAKGTYVSDVFLGYRQVPHFIIAVMREGADGKWVLRATIDTELFSELVESVRIGETGSAYLLNSEGSYQTVSRGAVTLMQKDSEIGTYPDSGNRPRTFIRTDPSGRTYLYAVTNLKEKGWRLVTRMDKADAFRSLRVATSRIFIAAILGGIFIVITALGLTRYIIGRIMRIDREKESLGQQLIRASRLAELGEMSAGFAHEVNNPLQIMKSELGLIQMLWNEMPKGALPPPPEDISQIEDCLDQLQLQVDRCGKITQGILQVARHSAPAPQRIDLCAFIPEVTAMIAKRAEVNGIDLVQHISEKPLPVFADPGQLQQVLLNLLNNAMDAALERHRTDGGHVEIKAAKIRPGRITVSVTDNGIGIVETNSQKIFSPFFTTKPAGKGTGLGLSVCYGIIQSMGGSMDFSSQSGSGSVFNFTLPADGVRRSVKTG